MNGVFEQAGGMGFEGAAMSGGLARKLSLNFRPDVNGDRHSVSPFRVIFSPLRLSDHPTPCTDPASTDRRFPLDELYIGVVTLAELRFGIELFR